ncbi:endonuclease III [Candidatus Woesearchaeota archaeon]|jgi:endonuclease III|nr:endonuclease III [Candidatus Woesearchaeota archaeon]MBT7062957.1 endonuclease III [Candidatus Woesearchaeota archaeon]MBT7402561.1 endonuclease III [Candidatus Woesearchaeota archaeon]
MEISNVIDILSKHVEKYDVPVAELIEVQTRDPFKVLVSTILSAQTKDQTTAKVSKKLFSVIDKPSDLKKLSIEDIEEIIRSANYHKTKARNIKRLENLKQVPDTMEELLKLSGVGRKTANIVLSVSFKKPAIAVDTHVHRISNRLGFVKTKTREQTEQELMKKLPKEYWIKYNYLLVAFGQNLCTPISPHCSKCLISNYCEKIGVQTSR